MEKMFQDALGNILQILDESSDSDDSAGKNK
jgi:hypothetical protein